ncbi:hypothetical protein NGM99_04505 [Mesorhizobium sp. RP14(2022)]|uniref:Uncharacterized protein n=1 Tax=Mesorhizobium liriopis TaxID=2953882 RepID=A0ABT1C2J5_9HYPH|nr:hypothetical protein [Mesorhizobium liriopis]MCO6049052.1 hypothetical protein [Mesorhizobium liriopis]
MSILGMIKRLVGNREAETSTASPRPDSGASKVPASGDPSKPAYEGRAKRELNPPIREAPKPGLGGGGAP